MSSVHDNEMTHSDKKMQKINWQKPPEVETR